MNEREFCYWLHGYFEIQNAGGPSPAGLTDAQVNVIRKHLDLAFKPVTLGRGPAPIGRDFRPSYGGAIGIATSDAWMTC